jgi:Kef-type K+ transport system membrane component KefB
MENMFFIAALWLALAVLSTVIAYHLKISIALVEICVGVAAGAFAARFFGQGSLGSGQEWLRFLAGTGAVLLTFLAGAELDPRVISTKKVEVLAVGLAGFLAPFAGCAALARFVLHWDLRASLLAGIVLSATSMAVIYSMLIETGLNKTEFGKGVLAASFINDLSTVIVLAIVFAPFTYKTTVFIAGSAVVLALFAPLTAFLTRQYGNRTAAIRAKWIVLVLFGLGALAYWAGSEAVLPAYIAGMLLAEFAAREDRWVRRMRTLTVGFLTPFYFIRAGTLVSIPAIVAAPLVLAILLSGKMISKITGIYPVISRFRSQRSERWFYTLLMSTGLTFGTIAALYGLSHGIVSESQYSLLVAAVIASAVIPALIAGTVFMPKHLLQEHKKAAGKVPVREYGIDEE